MQTGFRFIGIFKRSDIVRILEFNKKTGREIWGEKCSFCKYIIMDNKKLNHSVSFWKDVEVRAVYGDISGRDPR